MKKILCVVLCVVLVSGLALTLIACGDTTPREEILKLYMPGEYIDESIFDDFSAWYEEQTGKKVTVRIKTFDSVENIQLAVGANKSDYDLLCPSDYMVEYLIAANLVQKVDKNIIDVQKEGLFREEYLDMAERYFDPTLEYAVPYMYGTLGLVYDYSKTGKHLDSWEDFFGSTYAGRRSIKDSVRDAYAAACLYNNRETLNNPELTGIYKQAAVQLVFGDASEGAVNAAKATLKSAIDGGAVWDVDNVKFDMAANVKNSPAVAIMWSCDAGYVMNTYEDNDGVEHNGNRNLWYVVPKEGGNIYIDNFVISKYAKNVEAANYFLKYICQTDVAVKNCEYAGCISPLTEVYDTLLESYAEDEDGLFDDTPAGWKEMYLETMFPSQDVLDRCGVMREFSTDGKNLVNKMWSSLQ